MTIKLKLVGPSTYNSASTGRIEQGDIVVVSKEAGERLLRKGVDIADGEETFFKPHFQEVGGAGRNAPADNDTAARVKRLEDENAALQERLSGGSGALESANEELSREIEELRALLQASQAAAPGDNVEDEEEEEEEEEEAGKTTAASDTTTSAAAAPKPRQRAPAKPATK